MENIRNKAVEKGHVEYFGVKKVRPRSSSSPNRHPEGLHKPRGSGSTVDKAMDFKQESHNDLVGSNTLGAGLSTASVSQHLPNVSSQKRDSSLKPVSSRRRGQQHQCSDVSERNGPPEDDNDSLPELETIIEPKDWDNMELRPIPRLHYQNDGVIDSEHDIDYDPLVERAAEERRDEQRERRRQGATFFVPTSGMQKQALLSHPQMRTKLLTLSICATHVSPSRSNTAGMCSPSFLICSVAF